MRHIEALETKPKRLIGHSYGASVSQAIAEEMGGVEARSYGTPAWDLLGRREKEHTLRFKRWEDCVGSLDSGATLLKSPGWWPHSYAGYDFRSNETLS